jgi:PAS domain S-box-containing protein
MKNKDSRSSDAAELRRQAEEIIRKKALQLPKKLESMSPGETRQTLHELRVHQIELEMQNEALRKTQEELESSRVRYFDLYDLAPMGYFTLSEEGLILEANLTASSLLGVARSALVQKSLTRFIFREDQDIYYHYCQKLFKTGAAQVCELRMVKKNGSLFWVRLESTVAQDSESGDTGVTLCRTVISDITERKQAEEALHKALAQANEGKRILDALMEQVPEGITIADAPDVRIRMVSRYGRELTGKSKEILEGITFDKHTQQWDIYCADGVTPAKNQDLPLTRATQKGELVKNEEWWLGNQSGKRIPILCNAAPIKDDLGNIIGGVIAWRDITERKQAELLILVQRDLALTISFSHQLDEALSQCLDTILQLSEMECGGIYLIDQDSGDLNLICHRNLSPAFIKSVSHYQADSTRTRLVLQGKPLFTRYSELDLPLGKVRKAEKLLAFAVLPLIFEKRVIGCLTLGSQKLEDVSEINRQVLKTAATLIGEGIIRLQTEEELKETNQKLQKAMKSTIQAIALILEKRDPYTAGHQERMTKLACAIAEEISLSPDKIGGLYIAGIIHDIGKINIPTEILSKPGSLSEIELSLIQTHPQVGSNILKEMELPGGVSSIVLQHHERMDGSGYPSGLSGEAILLEARILAVADVVEAMASHRPYRPALGLDKAWEEITQNKGKLYDPEVVDACLKLFKEKGFKFE